MTEETRAKAKIFYERAFVGKRVGLSWIWECVFCNARYTSVADFVKHLEAFHPEQAGDGYLRSRWAIYPLYEESQDEV